MSQIKYNSNSGKDGAMLWIRSLYRSDEKSEMELILQTAEPMESKEAFHSLPIQTMVRLNGKGLTKTAPVVINSLGGPISKTVEWHLISKGLDFKDMDPTEVKSSLREVMGPGADLILEEMFGEKGNDKKDKVEDHEEKS